jgi:DUF1009 family protein
MPPKLGVLAGAGELPRLLVDACRSAGRDVFLLALKHHTDAACVDGVEHQWVRLGAIGSALKHLREAGVEELCLAGQIRRPSWRELLPDARGAAFLARVGFDRLGDAGLLGAIAGGLEGEGFKIVGAHDVAPELLAPAGPLTRRPPDDKELEDIRRGCEIAKAIGELDVGQGAIVQQGVVLAVEAAEGTDAMIARSKALVRKGRGGVLVKVPKPQQDRRLDLPTIGARTVDMAADAGLAGIAVAAGETLVVDRAATVARADRSGLFIVGIEVDR